MPYVTDSLSLPLSFLLLLPTLPHHRLSKAFFLVFLLQSTGSLLWSDTREPKNMRKFYNFQTIPFILVTGKSVIQCNPHSIYRIRSIKRCGYYLFYRPSLCGVYSRAATIQERRLLIPVAAREAILRETVDWYHWSRRFCPLCWCRRRLELVLDCLSCTCHRKRVARHVHVLVFSNSRRGAATIRERPLFRSALPEVRRLLESGD